ncbi:MAG: xanthine dehydrogenase molybdopterin binding subunit [Blastocatellia bacterium]|nr:xanthine dehydrogenase molybdopterin binding subunit [Blastocatellia bacterium]
MPVVGKNIPHDSARGHVSGESLYIDDMPFARNELLVDFVGSPFAHGKLIDIDLSEAQRIPGVVGLYTAKDLACNLFGPILKDEVLLVEDVAWFLGEPIVVIAAETRDAMRQAKAAVRITMEELPPVFTISEAIAKQQFLAPERFIRRGDLAAGFAAADHLLEGVFTNGGQDHFYLESQAALVYPGENNTLTVHSSTQHPTEVQEIVAKLLGLQNNQVVCITKRMGGGFGGKESQATHPAVMAGLVALRHKRPARIVFTKDDDMKVTGKRHPFENRYKVGFTNDGVITAFQVELYSNGGAYADLSTAVMARAMTHADNAYFLPNVEIKGVCCRTNLPPNTAFRGFGGPQGTVTIENIMEEIAFLLKKDPLEVRRANLYGETERNVTPYGEIVMNNMLPRLAAEQFRRSDYENRREAVRRFNAESKTHLKGLSCTFVKFGISFNTKFLNQASALVNIYLDGTVQVSTGATEMGQGVNTKIRQVVADQFAIEPEAVILMPTSTEKSNNASATAASSGADLNGSAAVDACQRLRTRLAEAAAKFIASKEADIEASPSNILFEDGYVFDNRRPARRMSFKELVKYAYHQRISLGERGFYATQGIDWNWETGSGNPFLYYTMGCSVAEVLLDRFTGALKVLRSDVLMDIGKSINPGIDRGQLTGAYIQGMGWVTTEELKYAANGDLLSHSPTTYKIPNIQDLPEVFNVDWIENDTNEVNLLRSKAVGEPPLLMAIAVWTAVKDALSAVSGDEIPRLHLPATNEEILMRLTHYRKTAASSVTETVETARV